MASPYMLCNFFIESERRVYINVGQTENGEKQAMDKRDGKMLCKCFVCVCCSSNKSINQDEKKKYYLCALCSVLCSSLDGPDNYMTMRRKEHIFRFTMKICTIDAILVFAQPRNQFESKCICP